MHKNLTFWSCESMKESDELAVESDVTLFAVLWDNNTDSEEWRLYFL